MSPTIAPVTGDVLSLLGTGANQLNSETKPCRQISIRSHVGNNEITIGDSSVKSTHRWAFVLEGETWSIGPFQPGVGLRPSDIYVRGTVFDIITWSGIWA